MMNYISDDFGHWFAGFADGESSFIMHMNDNSSNIPKCIFAITLRADDLPTLQFIKETLGIGKIRRNRNNAQGHTSVSYRVYSKGEVATLVEFFQKYPLRSKKANDFKIWSRAVGLWNSEDWRGRRIGEKQKVSDSMVNLMIQLREGRKCAVE